MTGGINRPVLPTTGQNPDEQRLRAGLGAIVRSFLDSGAFLTRLFPGKLQAQTVSSGTQVTLAWGDMNRLPPLPIVMATLPQVTPRHIGVPLTISKASPSGIALIQPAGVRIDGAGQPTVDGLSTGFQMQGAGSRQLRTDGVNWFTDSGRSSLFDVTVFWPAAPPIVNLTGNTHVMTMLWERSFLSIAQSGAATMTRLIVPTDAAFPSPIGAVFPFGQVASGQVQVIAASGVSILTAETLFLRRLGSQGELRHVGVNSWWLTGDLQLT